MIQDQEKFKLERAAVYASKDAAKIRAYAKQYSLRHILAMSDAEILAAVDRVNSWE